MPFDDARYEAPARNGDVGGVALYAILGLDAVKKALEKLAAVSGTDIADELSSVTEAVATLDERFNRLTGWKDPD